jgi:peptidoglycan hydrolase CwlO-like protein
MDLSATPDTKPSVDELQAALSTAHSLCQELDQRNSSLTADLSNLRSQVSALTTERDNAVATATNASAEMTKLRAAVPKMAAAQAAEILGSFGVAPAPSGRTSTGLPASAGAGSVKEQFKAMKPGSPEANQFYAKHRKELLG